MHLSSSRRKTSQNSFEPFIRMNSEMFDFIITVSTFQLLSAGLLRRIIFSKV
jgi:hypothetical protein